MLDLILIGLLVALFFYLLREDTYREYPDSYEEYRNNFQDEEDKAHREAIVDMSEEGYTTSLLRYDNFFKETYW